MRSLTARQSEVLALIRHSLEINGFPPTRAEIAQALGFKSVNAAEEHLKALVRKGVIEISPGASRGIRLSSQESGIPIVGRVAAGSPILAEQHIERFCPIAPDFFHPKANYLLQVSGMSMKDIGILDGDLIAVHAKRHALSGQKVVARLDQEVTVKRLKYDAEHIWLMPENPDYTPIQVSPNQQFEIEGLYVGILRNI